MIYRVLIGAGVLGGLLVYIYIQSLQLDAAETRAETAEQQQVEAKATIAELQARAERQKQLQREQAARQAEMARAASDRETTIRRLQRENEKLRDWADQPLPDPVVRMRRRPAITGAADYRQHLSDAEPLQPSGGGAGQQRRSEPADRAD